MEPTVRWEANSTTLGAWLCVTFVVEHLALTSLYSGKASEAVIPYTKSHIMERGICMLTKEINSTVHRTKESEVISHLRSEVSELMSHWLRVLSALTTAYNSDTLFWSPPVLAHIYTYTDIHINNNKIGKNFQTDRLFALRSFFTGTTTLESTVFISFSLLSGKMEVLYFLSSL